MKELKVFRMDEYTWVIAENKEQAIEWCNKEFDADTDTDADEVYECTYNGFHENSGYWGEVNMSDFDFPQVGMFKNWHGMFCKFIWFHEAVKTWDGDVPAVIATTEA